MSLLAPHQAVALAILANGIIPADERDGGAGCVDAGARLAAKIEAGIQTAVYLRGLDSARQAAWGAFGHEIDTLSHEEVHQLLANVRQNDPAFFKQLRADVCALYLSDEGVAQRIGFPGPSIATGGYPDFDKPPFSNRQQ